jgi:hypothetical protein
VEAIEKIRDDEWFGTEEIYKKVGQHLANLLTLCDEWALCRQTRIVNWQVLALFPGRQNLLETRREAMAESANSVHGTNGLADIIDAKMHLRIKAIHSPLNTQETLWSRRNDLRSTLKQAITQLKDSKEYCQGNLEVGSESLRLRNRALNLAIRINSGKIVEVLELNRETRNQSVAPNST